MLIAIAIITGLLFLFELFGVIIDPRENDFHTGNTLAFILSSWSVSYPLSIVVMTVLVIFILIKLSH